MSKRKWRQIFTETLCLWMCVVYLPSPCTHRVVGIYFLNTHTQLPRNRAVAIQRYVLHADNYGVYVTVKLTGSYHELGQETLFVHFWLSKSFSDQLDSAYLCDMSNKMYMLIMSYAIILLLYTRAIICVIWYNTSQIYILVPLY